MEPTKRDIDAELKAFNLVYYTNTLLKGMAKFGALSCPKPEPGSHLAQIKSMIQVQELRKLSEASHVSSKR